MTQRKDANITQAQSTEAASEMGRVLTSRYDSFFQRGLTSISLTSSSKEQSIKKRGRVSFWRNTKLKLRASSKQPPALGITGSKTPSASSCWIAELVPPRPVPE